MGMEGETKVTVKQSAIHIDFTNYNKGCVQFRVKLKLSRNSKVEL